MKSYSEWLKEQINNDVDLTLPESEMKRRYNAYMKTEEFMERIEDQKAESSVQSENSPKPSATSAMRKAKPSSKKHTQKRIPNDIPVESKEIIRLLKLIYSILNDFYRLAKFILILGILLILILVFPALVGVFR